MKPTEYLKELDELALNSCDANKEYHLGMKVGAQRMWELMNGKERAWRARNREKLRQYNREYARARRAKEKMMKEDIDKIANME